MKQAINLLITILVFNSAFAQTEKPIDKQLLLKFGRYYNAGQADSIFNLLSPEMKKVFPTDKIVEFITALKADAGSFEKGEFGMYEGSYAVYRTKFSNKLVSLFISSNNGHLINGFTFKPYVLLERNLTPLSLPVKEEWTVFQGGDTQEQNYHIINPTQKNAFDLLITDSNNKSFRNKGNKNEDYYAFGKKVYTPCDAVVVSVVNGVKDNAPGVMNPFFSGGNTVMLKTSKNEYLVFCHFKQNSIIVKEQQLLKKGQLLGNCGNSGNSSEPHIHFHIQDGEDLNRALGVKCYFERLTVNQEVKTSFSPIKGDRIKP